MPADPPITPVRRRLYRRVRGWMQFVGWAAPRRPWPLGKKLGARRVRRNERTP